MPGGDTLFVDIDDDEAVLGTMAGDDRDGRPAYITGSDAENVCQGFTLFDEKYDSYCTLQNETLPGPDAYDLPCSSQGEEKRRYAWNCTY